MKKLKVVGLAFLCVIAGLLSIVMAFTEPDFSIGSRIFAVICGLLFLLFAALYTFKRLDPEPQQAKRVRWRDRDDVFSVYDSAEGGDDKYPFLTTFRKHFAKFYSSFGIPPNPDIQQDVTQLYRSIAVMQKQRLDRKGIRMEFVSERKKYSEGDNVTSSHFFDGKNDVTEYTESIAAETTFTKDGKKLFSRISRQAAHYVFTGASTDAAGDDNMICPNCGASSTMTNLLDGCDFCGTRFRIEDLEKRVSAFGFRDDYRIRYEKYKIARSHFNAIVFTLQFVLYAIIWAVVCIFLGSDTLIEIGGNPATGILAAILAAAAASAMLAFLGTYLFWVFIFPLLQIGAWSQYASRKYLAKIRQEKQNDLDRQEEIRAFDPMFSVTAFYSDVQNKLAVIHFSDTDTTANAFFEEDIPNVSDLYTDVINMDMNEIAVTHYEVSDGLQRAVVQAKLDLLEEQDGKTQSRCEKLELTLIKSSTCKTQAVCVPVVFTCSSCSASLALETGKICPYCGRKLDLKQFDWVIADYRILNS